MERALADESICLLIDHERVQKHRVFRLRFTLGCWIYGSIYIAENLFESGFGH